MKITGTYNVRDLGGFTTESSNKTKARVFIRAGNLDKLPIASQQYLLEYGIKTVVDIRDEWEAKHYPNPFQHSPMVAYQNVPLIGDALSNDKSFQAESKKLTQLSEMYNRYIEHCQPQILKIFTVLAQSKSGTIFHCHAGKDRTGIITALLLRVMGVAVNDIAQDYSLSRQEIDHLVAEWRQYAIENNRDLEQLERNVASDPQTIIDMLDFVDAQYGSVAAYLKMCGLSDALMAQLKNRFLE